MQVTLGMLVGLTVTFLGVMLSWFGVRENLGLEFSSAGWAGKLAAAGPGALLVVCGTLLIYFCIQKEFVIGSYTPIPAIQNQQPVQSKTS